MRVIYLGNNWVGWQIYSWLKKQNVKIVGLVVHPQNKARYREELLAERIPEHTHLFEATDLHYPETIQKVQELKPDIAVSVYFGYILKHPFITIMPEGCINVHPSYLPYNRGTNPNVWSIVEGTPAGVTIHYIDSGIDTGDIIAQKQIPVEPIDTGETLYRKQEEASVALFQETWPLIQARKISRIPQSPFEGTFHRTSDLKRIDEIDLNREYIARDLINIIRARTFPPYPGAYFLSEGRKVFVRLQLEYAEDVIYQ